MAERKEIRNSTAEFLIFQIEGKEQGIEVFYKDKTVWCTQKAMGTLFDVNIPAISKHLKNIYEQGELTEERTVSKMEIVRMEGNRQVKRETVFYNLDAVISVGYRVNSIRATQFRQWATSVLREFAIRGYVLDKKRMENGSFLGEDYFEHLLAEIREIRLSERRFYQKLTDIYATAVDYNRDAPTTRSFFKMMQNKMHYAVHGRTAAELIVERADAEQEHMGLTSWENAPEGKIVKTDVVIAKNYLKEAELADMGQLVNGVLELAERMTKRHIPMTMEDWAKRIDTILASGGNEVLQTAGQVTAEQAKEHAETEFEKYRIIQDRLFQSDFDRYMDALPFDEDPKD
ncbi:MULTISPECIES: virulence RhuM family protein [unclassified Bacteroides]|uniref:virulence RhuM family protein n=1 Tax=unclassified Bacteroides TaxID=2646097 RepID=UPI0004E125BA|nr:MULTISPECIES: virulence RhuM family protein [unclassified Bacteroides]